MHPDAPILSLFGGIGGFERGLGKAGFTGPVHTYENWDPARSVLAKRFPRAVLHADVRELPNDMHDAHVVVAGFPCTDLSQAGKQAGLDGSASGLILGVLEHVRLAKPEWVLLENVPNMLRLNKGNAIRVITDTLEEAGYSWTYRILDAQHFGVAQRRKRVFVLASRYHDPTRVLFRDLNEGRAVHHVPPSHIADANGFYWSEGNRGVGWGVGVVPTIKGSTTAGIPTSPAVWLPGAEAEHRFQTPSIEALEILQGFTAGWTKAAPVRDRWKLVGNAVAVPVVQWLAEGLKAYDDLDPVDLTADMSVGEGWGWSGALIDGRRLNGKLPDQLSAGPLRRRTSLARLLQERGSRPLSQKAARGFTTRLRRSNLTRDPGFMTDLESYSGL
ncbi:DNA cytosine methyltransferase [Cryobacterium serini]|uniref:DNA (cytosine-5-)-methyltransferase n=1 Tax=Cryobacterium serini TaxID=1259201 RepID=A0A4R9BV88_9MICO|nr:DNA (cytosine-5-)-methyltransferase [Cryobacterium serini]TFD91232.1 DNA (cytosine-5-)-methyltransferase [Cryobacterium serini]